MRCGRPRRIRFACAALAGLILVWRLDTQLDVHVCFSLRACVALAAPHPRRGRLRRLRHRSGGAADAEHVSAASLFSLLTGAIVNSSQRCRRRGPCVCSGRRRLPQRARGRLWSSRANEREPAECCGHLALLSPAVGVCRPLAGSKAVSPQHSIATLSLLSASDFVAAREQMCRLRRLSVRGDPLSHPHACLCRSAAGKGLFHSA